jgi:hypothetical protein
MNQTGTEFSQSSESLVSSPNACSATGTLTVPLEGYLYAQCNLNPGTVLASVNVTVP